MEESSSFFDGVVASYTPSLPEIALGLGGLALAGAVVVVGLRALRFLPAALARCAARLFSIAYSGAWQTTLPRSSKPLRPARPAICLNSTSRPCS